MRGEKGVKGDICAPGVPRMKGEPGESVSAPNMTVSPSHLTVNQSNTAFLLCSVSGNPVPQVAWSRVNGVLPSNIRRWRVISSQGKKRLRVLLYKVSQLATCFGKFWKSHISSKDVAPQVAQPQPQPESINLWNIIPDRRDKYKDLYEEKYAPLMVK